MSGHITYISGFYANQSTSYSVFKIEWPSTSFFIPVDSAADPANPDVGLNGIRDEAIPWCGNREEIVGKSLLFRRDASSQFDGLATYYLFNDRDGATCWTPFAGGNPSYENRQIVGGGRLFGVRVRMLASALDITPDGRVKGEIGF